MGNVTPTKKKLTTIDKIEKKYSKSSFLETYGGSVTSAILILGAFTIPKNKFADWYIMVACY